MISEIFRRIKSVVLENIRATNLSIGEIICPAIDNKVSPDRKSERNDCEWRGRCSSRLFITRSRLRGYYPIFPAPEFDSTSVRDATYANRRPLRKKRANEFTTLRTAHRWCDIDRLTITHPPTWHISANEDRSFLKNSSRVSTFINIEIQYRLDFRKVSKIDTW